MASGDCCRFICPIILGVIATISGIILTLIGNFAKPFWSEEDSWCDHCKKSRETTLKNLRNCRKAGPILIGIGVFLVVFFCIRRRRSKANEPKEGTAVISYTSTGTIPASHQVYGPPTTSGYQPVNLNPSYNQAPHAYPPMVQGYSGVQPYPSQVASPGIVTNTPPVPHPYPPGQPAPQGGVVYPQPVQGYQDLPPPPDYSSVVQQPPTMDHGSRPPPFNPSAPPGH